MAQEQSRHGSALGVAYAGIAVGALAVVGATAVGLRLAGRPAVDTLTIGRGWLVWRRVARRR